MSSQFISNPFLFFMVFPLVSGIIGSLIAMTKEKDILSYFLLCLIPVFLIYAVMQRSEDDKYFRQCISCNEFLPWDTKICTKCNCVVKKD